MSKAFRLPLLFAIGVMLVVFVTRGPQHALTVIVLAIFEFSSSFDNAILNVEILQGMTARWRARFLTYGVLIGVGVVRVLLPFVLICITTGQWPGTVVTTAIQDPMLFSIEVGRSRDVVAAFGGAFLASLFLVFFATEDETWIPIPRQLRKSAYGTIVLAAVIALVGLWLSWFLALSAVLGVALHFLLQKLSGKLEARRPGVGGLRLFLYLEFLDSVFSFDGVVGAFALDKDLVDIMLGLTLGALSIRALTVHFAEVNSLKELRYLKAGALWSVGLLAAILLIGLWFPLPDWVAMASITLIVIAAIHSVFARRVSR